MNDWISLKKEMPDLDQIVWLYDGSNMWIGGRAMVDNRYWLWGNTYSSIWYNGEKWDGDIEADDDYKPTYWQPLPEPPTETDKMKSELTQGIIQ